MPDPPEDAPDPTPIQPPIEEGAALDPDPAEAPPADDPRPWGPWATLGFTAAVVAAYFAVQVAFGIVYVIVALVQNPESGPEAVAERMKADMDFQWAVTLASDVVVVALVLLFSWLRRGTPVRVSLSWRRPPWRAAALWTFATLAYCVSADLLFRLLGLDAGETWARDAWAATRWLPLLVLAVNVAAPVVEELFFRGFLFAGLNESRGGAPLAVAVPALLWSLVHVQYGIQYIAVIFVGGILLGAARARTRSLATPMLMHFVWNLYATIQIMAVQGI